MSLHDDIKKYNESRNISKNKSGQRKHSRLVENSRGKWHTLTTLAEYRIKRNKKNKIAKASRKANRVS